MNATKIYHANLKVTSFNKMFIFLIFLVASFQFQHLKCITSKYDVVDEYNVELMLVIDPEIRTVPLASPSQNHIDYVLEKFKLADEIFRNYQTENNIKLSVYNYIEHHLPSISKNAYTIHDLFCEWQKTAFTPAEHSRFDLILYITPYTDSGMSLATYSRCSIDTKCAVISFTFEPLLDVLEETIAHEIGHFLNSPHDDSEKCKTLNPKFKLENFIMWPITEGGFLWSKCSMSHINRYLKSEYSVCLHDKPKINLLEKVPLKLLPHKDNTRTRLCQLIHDDTHFFNYKNGQNFANCMRMFCTNQFGFEFNWTVRMPNELNGLECANGKICFNGNCTKKPDLKPVNGGWSKWTDDPKCSLECGGGVKLRRRFCTHPAPRNGGKYCVGESTQYKPCNQKSCSSSAAQSLEKSDNSVRDLQCINSGKSLINVEKPCALFCTDGEQQLSVADGTPCFRNVTGKCLGGYCRPADCKNVLFGTAKLDACGVCNGKNANCVAHNKTNANIAPHKRLNINFRFGYLYDVGLIPKGAASISITLKNRQHQDSYLALYSTTSRVLTPFDPKTILEDRSVFSAAEMLFEYDKTDRAVRIVKSIAQTGRLTVEPLHIYVLDYNFQGAQSVTYQWFSSERNNFKQ